MTKTSWTHVFLHHPTQGGLGHAGSSISTEVCVPVGLPRVPRASGGSPCLPVSLLQPVLCVAKVVTRLFHCLTLELTGVPLCLRSNADSSGTDPLRPSGDWHPRAVLTPPPSRPSPRARGLLTLLRTGLFLGAHPHSDLRFQDSTSHTAPCPESSPPTLRQPHSSAMAWLCWPPGGFHTVGSSEPRGITSVRKDVPWTGSLLRLLHRG